MKIGPASTATGVSQRMIRHYEKIGLVPQPPRRDSGYRDKIPPDQIRLPTNGRERSRTRITRKPLLYNDFSE